MSDDVSERLREIRERVEAATEGPWIYKRRRTRPANGIKTRYSFCTEARRNSVQSNLPAPIFAVEKVHNQPDYEPIEPEDADFIAHSRSDVPYLLSLVERQNEVVSAARELVDLWMSNAISVEQSDLGAELHNRIDQLSDALRDAALQAEGKDDD